MAIRIDMECDVCKTGLLNGFVTNGGRSQLANAPALIEQNAAEEGWLVEDDYVLCRRCQERVEGLGYARA